MAMPSFMSQSAMMPMDREAMLEQMRQQIRLAEILAPEGSEERDLARQQAYADELRKTAMPRGRSAGGIFRASNPLEFVAAGVQQGQGEGAQSELEDKRKQSMWRLITNMKAERDRTEDQIRKMQGGQPATQTPRRPEDEYNPFMGGY